MSEDLSVKIKDLLWDSAVSCFLTEQKEDRHLAPALFSFLCCDMVIAVAVSQKWGCEVEKWIA